jgi:anti-sigma-K factor RskA
MTDPIDGGLTCDEVRDLAAAFVLGALDADEMDAVRRHLASCAEPHPEFAELGSVVPVLAVSVPAIEPSPALKGRIMAAAAADLEAREALSARVPEPAATVAPSPAGSAAPGLEVAPAPRPAATPVAVMPRPATSAGTWLMRIAAVLAIVVLGGWNLLLQGQLATAQSYEDAVTAVLDVAGQEGSLTAVLTAEGDGGPTGLAAVSADGEITLAMRDLPATSGGEVYEAWVIAGDGVPVPLGDFQVDSAGTAFFTGDGLPTESGIVLALTREPGPGATTPTMPIVSLGTATAAS